MTHDAFNRHARIIDAVLASADPFTDPTKTGIFRDHRCVMCDDGEKPCREGAVNLCGNPRARNE